MGTLKFNAQTKLVTHDQLHALVVEDDVHTRNATGPLQIYMFCRAQLYIHFACKREYFGHQGH